MRSRWGSQRSALHALPGLRIWGASWQRWAQQHSRPAEALLSWLSWRVLYVRAWLAGLDLSSAQTHQVSTRKCAVVRMHAFEPAANS